MRGVAWGGVGWYAVLHAARAGTRCMRRRGRGRRPRDAPLPRGQRPSPGRSSSRGPAWAAGAPRRRRRAACPAHGGAPRAAPLGARCAAPASAGSTAHTRRATSPPPPPPPPPPPWPPPPPLPPRRACAGATRPQARARAAARSAARARSARRSPRVAACSAFVCVRPPRRPSHRAAARDPCRWCHGCPRLVRQGRATRIAPARPSRTP